MSVIKVAIVEDDRGIREGLAEMIRNASGFEICGIFDDAESAARFIPKQKPDVVLMDINLPRSSGIECTRILKSEFPSVQIIIQTVYDDVDRIFDALKAGASGYLVKHASSETLLEAIRDVMRGGAPMSSAIARKVVQSFHEPADTKADSLSQLSKRKVEVLQMLAKGYKNQEIAAKLFISIETVRQHLHSIYSKLHVRTRTEAVIKYMSS